MDELIGKKLEGRYLLESLVGVAAWPTSIKDETSRPTLWWR